MLLSSIFTPELIIVTYLLQYHDYLINVKVKFLLQITDTEIDLKNMKGVCYKSKQEIYLYFLIRIGLV